MAFSEETLKFLFENRIRNDKNWFLEHKHIYQEHVAQPLLELAEHLGETARDIDHLLITDPKKTVSRVYRDLRFSKDKSLYRDVMWCAFVRDKKEFSASPGFFFEISPDGFRYGCGYYSVEAATMEVIRKLILGGDKDFLAVRQAMEKQKIFTIEGDMYKRSRYPDQPEELRSWLDRKNLYFVHNSQDSDLLYSASLWKVVGDGFRVLAPLYHFFLRARGIAKQ